MLYSIGSFSTRLRSIDEPNNVFVAVTSNCTVEEEQRRRTSHLQLSTLHVNERFRTTGGHFRNNPAA